MAAKLYFRYSAMNAGKSSALIQVAHNYEEKGMEVAVVKPAIDTKGDNMLVSRIGMKRKVDLLVNFNDDVNKLIKEYSNQIRCVLVDEAQFLAPQQIDQLRDLVIEDNIPVICYGLRTDFQMKGFPGSTRLLEIAHSIEEIKNVCSCGSKSTYNMRFIDGKPVFSGEQVAIDGISATYDSVCGKCYKKFKANS